MDLVFTDEWIASQEQRWDRRADSDPAAQQLLVRDPARRPLRSWIEAEVALLEERSAPRVVPRLRSEDLFQSTVNELGVGALLRASGFAVWYDPDFDGQTPDWYGETISTPGVVVEVATRPNTFAGERRRWNRLRERVRQLGPRWTLFVRDARRVSAPDDGAQKHIARELARFLGGGERSVGDELVADGYTFWIHSESLIDSADLVVPAVEAGWTDYVPLTEIVGEKASRYRSLCERTGLPLVVVVASDVMNGHDAEGMLLEMNSTQNVFEATFGPDTEGLIIDQSRSFDDRPLPEFPPVVSDVLFMTFTVERLSWRPIGSRSAARPLGPNTFTSQVLRPGL